jgi:hypothetical protein
VTNMASNMVAQVKPITLVPSDYLIHGFDLRFFCGAIFLRPLGLDEIKLGFPNVMFRGQSVTKSWLRFRQLHQLLRQVLECRNHEVLIKDWILSVGRRNAKFVCHSPLC